MLEGEDLMPILGPLFFIALVMVVTAFYLKLDGMILAWRAVKGWVVRHDELARILVAAVVLLAVSSVDRCAEGAEVTPESVCAPYRGHIADAADLAGVPVALLTALVFAESTCNSNAINAKTGAIGLGQILTTGAGRGYTANELREPWLNLSLSAGHLAAWHKRCGSWRGAVRVYHGSKTCRTPSVYADKVIRIWREIEKRNEVRS